MSELAAIGKTDNWEMTVDENGMWSEQYLEMSFTLEYCPHNDKNKVDSSWYLDIAIKNCECINELLTFMNNKVADSLLTFGIFNGFNVEFNFDDEFDDRMFLKIFGHEGGAPFIWTIAGPALEEFILCLQDLVDNLKDYS